MAKPDLDDGFLQIAHELFAALMVVPLRKEARIVLAEVFSKIYGPAKQRSFKLSPTKLAAATGLQKQNVSRGIVSLVENGLLRRDGLDTYVFVKDYESWGSCGVPLIDEKTAWYVSRAPKLARMHTFDKVDATPDAKRDINPGQSVIQSDDKSPLRNGENQSVIRLDNPSNVDASSNRIGFVIQADYAPSSMCIDKDKEDVVFDNAHENVDSQSDRIPDTTPPPTVDPSVVRPPTPPSKIRLGPDGKPLLWSMSPFHHDPAEVEAMAAHCAALAGPDEDTLPGNVRRNSPLYPLWYFRHSIRLAIGATVPGQYWRYALGVMRNLWDRGIIDESELAPAERIPVAIPDAASPPPTRRLTAYQARLAEDEANIAAMRTYKPKFTEDDV